MTTTTTLMCSLRAMTGMADGHRVVLLVFDRPEPTSRMLEVIRQVRTRKSGRVSRPGSLRSGPEGRIGGFSSSDFLTNRLYGTACSVRFRRRGWPKFSGSVIKRPGSNHTYVERTRRGF